MYEIFEKLINEKGLIVADVCRATGLKAPTFSDWKKGKSKPNAEKLLLIAKCLGTTVEYLMTGEDIRIPAPMFDKEHIELITMYSQLKKEQKNAVFSLLRSFCSK